MDSTKAPARTGGALLIAVATAASLFASAPAFAECGDRGGPENRLDGRH
jgi:hypothetical protein